MVDGTGRVEKNHADHENRHGGCADGIGRAHSPKNQSRGADEGSSCADEMGDCASGIFENRLLDTLSVGVGGFHIYFLTFF